MNISNRLIAAGIGIAALIPGTAASARERQPTIDLGGIGSYVDEGWRMTAAGTVGGNPFQGEFHAAMYPDGGAWPTHATCITGSISAVIDGPHRNQIWSVAVGDICRTDSASGTIVFTGQFDAYDSTPKRYSDIQGQMVLQLTSDGTATLALHSE